MLYSFIHLVDVEPFRVGDEALHLRVDRSRLQLQAGHHSVHLLLREYSLSRQGMVGLCLGPFPVRGGHGGEMNVPREGGV